MPVKPTPVVERILKKCVVEPDGCWTFTGSRSQGGYARIGVGHRRVAPAHRVMYEEQIGPIPDGLDLDHLCRNRACVNPSHLEPVTRSVNLRRGIGPEVTRARHAAKTHCPRGHPYDGENTKISRQGTRACRRCANEQRRRAAS